jgi:hypothetical protein
MKYACNIHQEHHILDFQKIVINLRALKSYRVKFSYCQENEEMKNKYQEKNLKIMVL